MDLYLSNPTHNNYVTIENKIGSAEAARLLKELEGIAKENVERVFITNVAENGLSVMIAELAKDFSEFKTKFHIMFKLNGTVLKDTISMDELASPDEKIKHIYVAISEMIARELLTKAVDAKIFRNL